MSGKSTTKLCGNCSNRDPAKFRHYRIADEVIGKYCKECQTEWLKVRYLTQSGDVSDAPSVGTADENFYQNKPVRPKVTTVFQVQSARTKIDTRYFAEILKPGDHIAWHREYGYWHHAIVSEVNRAKNEIMVIHWSPNVGPNGHQIKEESHVVTSEEIWFNQMYRIDYSEDVTNNNIPELVLARARSRKGDLGYDLFTDNCEGFATYCKTGCARSHQVAWLQEKIKEIIGIGPVKTVAQDIARRCFTSKEAVRGLIRTAGDVIPGEILEEFMGNSQAVGIGVLFFIETGFVIYDTDQAYAERKNAGTSRCDFVEATVRRIIEGLAAATTAAGLSFLFEMGMGALIGGLGGSPIGIWIGEVAGGIIGGLLGGAFGRAMGTWVGSLAGKAIAYQFPDDRAVKKVSDLKPGDHIVMNGWLFHPRCHAIVVDYKTKDKYTDKESSDAAKDSDEGEDQILVIRNTHEHGIIKEWRCFEEPLIRVEYKKGDCVDPDQVLKNATSMIGQYRYDLGTYNCKTFARRCKTVEGFWKQPSIGKVIGTNLGGATGAVVGYQFSDDIPVMKASDLKVGDHIVMKGWSCHPRCHAIVVDSRKGDIREGRGGAKPGDKVEGQIRVIRNTHKHGIVKEWVTFEQPLYRKEYKEGDCLDPDQVLKNAESMIGQYRYDLGTYNCKTFARRCKTVEGFWKQPSIGKVIGTNLGGATGAVVGYQFSDDIPVAKASDLKAGDHIVMKGWSCHPRCHAIVVESRDEDNHGGRGGAAGDKVEGQILVIRNTYYCGIIKEWVTFEKPLYRKEYKQRACLDPGQVLQNAESKIGQHRYNLATHNCKTFATRCKTVEGFSEQPL